MVVLNRERIVEEIKNGGSVQYQDDQYSLQGDPRDLDTEGTKRAHVCVVNEDCIEVSGFIVIFHSL